MWMLWGYIKSNTLDAITGKANYMNMGDRVQHFLSMLSKLTRTESDMIKEILHWHDEDKSAFLLAK